MRDKILAIIRRNCEQQMFEANTAIIISEQIHISRNETASLLHALTTQKKVIKIGARPSFFLDREFMEQEYGMQIPNNSYKSVEFLMSQCRDSTAINLSNF